MRIVIEIDGDQMTATTVRSQGEEAAAPPAELRRAAEALGAMSAGPAPAQPGVAVRPGELGPLLETLAAGPIDAGAAIATADEATARAKEPAKPKRRSTRATRSTRGDAAES